MAQIRERFFMAYDISDDKRRIHLVKILEEFGVRSQFSLFEFWLTKARKIELLSALREKHFLQDNPEESFLIIPIPESFENKIERYGQTTKIFETPIMVSF